MRLLVAVLAFVLVVPATASAGVVIPSATIDEYADWQSIGVESAFFGPALPASGFGNSVTVHPALGGYGTEGILVGASAMWHTTNLVPWNMGASVGVVDLDLAGATWTVALSSGRELWSSGRSSLAIEGALAYQFLTEDSNNELAFELGDPDFASGELVIVDKFRWVHVMAHAMYSLDLGFLTPMVEVGFTGTRYQMHGNVWDGVSPIAGGGSRSERGGVGSPTVGLGVSLNTRGAVLFTGVKGSGGSGVFQVNVGGRF